VEARLNPSLARELEDIVCQTTPREDLASAGPLLVAARTLSSAAASEMTATTVVGMLGLDDLAAFRALVQEIVDDFDLEATVKLQLGSFSVRFSRPPADGTGLSV
jgi:hypothetical protein